MEHEDKIKIILANLIETHEDMMSGDNGLSWLNRKRELKNELIECGATEEQADFAMLHPIDAYCKFFNISIKQYYSNKAFMKHKDLFLAQKQ